MHQGWGYDKFQDLSLGELTDKSGSELIDKYFIIIRAKSDINGELIKYAEEKNVKILFENDVKKLISKMGRTYLVDSLY